MRLHLKAEWIEFRGRIENCALDLKAELRFGFEGVAHIEKSI